MKEVRERQVYDIAYMWNQKNDINELIYKTEITSQICWKNIYGYHGGKERDKLGVWDWHIYTAISKITNKDILYSTGKSAQYYVISWIWKRIDKHICITESLCTPETNTILLINYTPV